MCAIFRESKMRGIRVRGKGHLKASTVLGKWLSPSVKHSAGETAHSISKAFGQTQPESVPSFHLKTGVGFGETAQELKCAS